MKKSYVWSIVKPVGMSVFAAIGAAWSVLEIIPVCPLPQKLLDSIKNGQFIILVIVGLVVAVYRGYNVIRQFFFPHFNINETGEASIRICRGNILNQTKGTVIVGINEEYETAPEKIGPSSIHKQLLEKYDSQKKTITDAFLSHKTVRDLDPARPAFFEERIGENHIIFLPMSTLNPTHAAETTLEKVREALYGLFSAQGNISVRDETVFCPLLGTGEAGMSLSREDTVRMIVRTFIICFRKTDLNSKIKHLTVTVRPEDYWKINWAALNRDLAFIIDNCGGCEAERI